MPGGNQGQQIRDEILHIMSDTQCVQPWPSNFRHRNKIPETPGHFYEQLGTQSSPSRSGSQVAPETAQQHDSR